MNIQYQTAAYGMSPFIHFLPDALRPIPVVTTFHDLRFPYLFPKAGRAARLDRHAARARVGWRDHDQSRRRGSALTDLLHRR